MPKPSSSKEIAAGGEPPFAWDDPLGLDGELSEEERRVRDTARRYAEDKLAPRILAAYREEHFDRAILTEMGAIGAMDVDAIPASLIDRARHIHSGCFYLQETSRDRLPGFFASVRARGITTSFDTNWDPTGNWDGGVAEMLRACDVFFPNAAEARRISRLDDVEAAARSLARLGATGRADGGPTIAVKLGAAGALACRAEGPLIRVPAMPVEPVDTTGAGDSFNAGFLRAWLDGADLRECLRWGAVSGAISTRRLGGIDGQPTRAEAVAALEGYPQ